MQRFRESLPIVIVISLFVALCALAYYLLMVHTENYFVQIDNSEVQEISPSEYKYNLTAYDEHGKMHEVEFTAYKKLREDAYLKLEVMSIRGVVNWEEVQYDDLPLDTRTHLTPAA